MPATPTATAATLTLRATLPSPIQVRAFAQTKTRVLQPIEVKVGPGQKDVSFCVMLIDVVVELLRQDVVAREHFIKSSELWKSGQLQKEPKVIADMVHGSALREHP